MTAERRRAREVLSTTLNWTSLAYGLFATAVEPVWDGDDVQIAVGVEVVVLSLVGFLFAGRRGPLGWALIVTGAAAPVAMLSTATLFWDSVALFTSSAFWVSTGVGAAVGLPFVMLGVRVLRRRGEPAESHDRWWLIAARWVIVAGLWIVVLAFRAGAWDAGIPFVYGGGALALAGLLIAVPAKLGVTRRGIGLLLLFLGGAALAVIAVSAAAVGSHMSGAEAMVGIVPAAVVAAIGAVLAATARTRPAPEPATRRPARGDDGSEQAERIALDLPAA